MKVEIEVNEQPGSNGVTISTIWPITVKWLAVSLVYIAYFYAFIFLVESLGLQISTFVTAPVLLAAWLFGLRAGLLIGLSTFPVNFLLIFTMPGEDWQDWLFPAGVVASAGQVLVGAVAGELRDLIVTVQKDLSERNETERERALVEEVARIVTSTLEISRVYESFAAEVKKVMDFDRMSISTYDRATRLFTVRHTVGQEVVGYQAGDVGPLEDTLNRVAVGTGRTLLRSDFAAGQVPADQTNLDAGLHSVMVAPLMFQDRPIGTIGLRSRKVDAYGSREKRILQGLSNQIAPALRNSQLFEETRASQDEQQRLAEETAVIAEIGRIVSSSLNVEEVYHRFVEAVRRLIPFDRISIASYDSGSNTFTRDFIADVEVPGRLNGDVTESLGTINGQAAQSGVGMRLQGETQEELTHRFPGSQPLFDVGLQSFLSIPLISKDEVVAVFDLMSMVADAYTKRHLTLAERVGSQIAGAISSTRLYTKLAKAQEALVNSEELFRQMAENIREVLWLADFETQQILYVSPAYAEIWGRKGHNCYENPKFWLDGVHPDDLDRVISAHLKQGITGELSEEFRIVRPDGSVRHILDRGFPVRDQSGRIYRIVGLAEDITERKLAEEGQRELAVVEERNRMAREIHDTLAQSLTGILLRLHTAGELLLNDPESARTELESAGGLARESLAEARRSVWDLQPQALESSSLVEAIGQEVARMNETDIQAIMEVEGQEPESIDRPNSLAVLRIAQESLSNISHHSNARTARLRLAFGPSEVRLDISDDGVGFDPSVPREALASAGRGFGLTSMQERALLAGGDFEIQSAPGMGAQVRAQIPYQPTGETPRSGHLTPVNGNHTEDETADLVSVLIVDDHELVRQGIRSTLERAGGVIVVGEAGDGEEAIVKIRKLDPDVVLLDVQMPKLDGVETVKRLGHLGLDAQVILMSIYEKDEYIFEGLRAGARGYLRKEVSRNELVQAIREVHAGRSLLQPVTASRLVDTSDSNQGAALTERELEVLQLLADGKRDKEVADELIVSVRTVRFHVENLYQKLGVRNRTEAVRVATERDILTR